MPVTPTQLAEFAVAAFVIVVIPGPAVLFLVGRALTYGRRAALATQCGHAAGSYLVAACVALGIGSLVERSAQVFLVVKLLGAAYLVWLGVQAIRHRKGLARALDRSAGPSTRRGALGRGFLVGITNPKAFILFGAILPQFVDRAAGDVPAQMLVLALVPVGIGAVSDTAWVLGASGFRSWFARSPRRLELVGGAGGLAMIGVAVSLVVAQRSD